MKDLLIMRILLVEMTSNGIIIAKIKAVGYAVDHARGEEGLSLALTEPYDTAIVDIMLPNAMGYPY